MNLDDFKSEWNEAGITGDRFDEIASIVRTKTQKFESGIFWRDVAETIAAGIVIIGFAPAWFKFPNWLARTAVIAIALSAIEIVVVLHWTRRKDGPPAPDLPVQDYCRAEIVRIERQIWLIKNVFWWYISPALLGICLFTAGISTAKDLKRIGFWIAIAVFVTSISFVYWLNQRAIRRSLIPLRDSIAAHLKECDPGITPPCDEAEQTP